MESEDARPIEAAMVLAAGLGTRMRPLTDRLPKPLIRLAGRPLIDHALDRLAAAGIERAVVNVHHFADQIEAHLRTRTAPRIIISDERGGILETGGGVRKALPSLGRHAFIVHNSDSVWSEGPRSNLNMLTGAWEPERMAALLLLAPRDASIGYEGQGDFHMDPAQRLIRRTRGESAPFIFAGVSILTARLFENTTDRAFSLNVIFDRAIADNALFGAVLDGAWIHAGTPGALLQAESYFSEDLRRRA